VIPCADLCRELWGLDLYPEIVEQCQLREAAFSNASHENPAFSHGMNLAL
jgi:hypothetical protein